MPERRGRGSRRDVEGLGGLRNLGQQINQNDAGRVANASGLQALGNRVDQAHGQRTLSKRSRRRRRLFIGLGTAAAVIAAAVGGGFAYIEYRFHQINQVHIADEKSVASGQPFNILVIGSDSRVGLSQAQQKADGNSAEVVGQRSDVVMIWHVVPSTKALTIMSIPRDTMMSMVADTNNLGQYNRINSAFNNGPNQLVQTIQENLGIPINHVIQIGFDGFAGTVNALGGIYLDFPYPARDAYSQLNITTPGCQLVDGAQALAVARSRHYEYFANGYWQYDPTSDFGRIQRQDAFLRALVDTAKSKVNPLTINAFIGSIHNGVVIDDGFSASGLIGLAEDFRSFGSTALKTYTFPTIDAGDVAPWGDVLWTDEPAAEQMLVSIFGTSELTTPSLPPPTPDLTAVSVPPATTTVPPISSGSSGSTGPAVNTPPSFDPTPCTPH